MNAFSIVLAARYEYLDSLCLARNRQSVPTGGRCYVIHSDETVKKAVLYAASLSLLLLVVLSFGVSLNRYLYE